MTEKPVTVHGSREQRLLAEQRNSEKLILTDKSH